MQSPTDDLDVNPFDDNRMRRMLVCRTQPHPKLLKIPDLSDVSAFITNTNEQKLRCTMPFSTTNKSFFLWEGTPHSGRFKSN